MFGRLELLIGRLASIENYPFFLLAGVMYLLELLTFVGWFGVKSSGIHQLVFSRRGGWYKIFN